MIQFCKEITSKTKSYTMHYSFKPHILSGTMVLAKGNRSCNVFTPNSCTNDELIKIIKNSNIPCCDAPLVLCAYLLATKSQNDFILTYEDLTLIRQDALSFAIKIDQPVIIEDDITHGSKTHHGTRVIEATDLIMTPGEVLDLIDHAIIDMASLPLNRLFRIRLYSEFVNDVWSYKYAIRGLFIPPLIPYINKPCAQ